MEPNKNALSLLSLLRRLLGFSKNLASRRVRQLQLCETLPLGEKRFIAIVQVGDQKYLLGGASNNVALLAHLDPAHAAEPQPVKQVKATRKRAPKKLRPRAVRATTTPAPVGLSASWAAAMRNAESPAPRIVLS